MICPRCGLSLPDEAETCTRCGTVIQTLNNNKTLQNNQAHNKKVFLVSAVIVSFFVFMLICAALNPDSVRNSQSHAAAVQPLAPGEIASDYEAALAYGRQDDPVRWAKTQTVVRMILASLNISIIPGTHQVWGEVLADGLIEHKEDFRVPNGQKGQYVVHADKDGKVWRVSVEGQVVYDHLNEYKQLTGAR